jgi:glyoxylase-like metal-dependent hydrolase (beta-lactamase superfamily II)
MMEYGVATMHGGALIDSLRELGRSPESIEAVAITHLHMEHLGWAAHPAPGQTRPAFAHADYLISQNEWDNRLATHGVTEQIADVLAPRIKIVADGDEVFPGVRAVELPGHTAGQLGYSVTSGGGRLIAFADVMHSPVQAANPDWPIVGESDPGKSAELRRRILGQLADEQPIGFGIHFADVPFGRVRRTSQAFAWEPLT